MRFASINALAHKVLEDVINEETILVSGRGEAYNVRPLIGLT